MCKKTLLITFLLVSNCYSDIQFHGTKETLETIATIIKNKKSGCYLRFGDGDLNLAHGQGELYQPFNSGVIKQEMREAFVLNDENILKTLPLYCKEFNGLEPHMFPGNHEVSYEQAQYFIARAQPLWGAEMTDVYSHVALSYAAQYESDLCIQFLRFLKSQNCIAFVGNTNIPHELITLLFGETISIIPTPARNSFSAIDQIQGACQEVLRNHDEYKIIILSMGCSGRILAKRLWKEFNNVFIFDFGSLMDALCGWNTRAWIELTNFDREIFFEKLKQKTEFF